MDTVTFQDVLQPDQTILTYAIIDNGNGQFTSMLKTTYDAQVAAALAAPKLG